MKKYLFFLFILLSFPMLVSALNKSKDVVEPLVNSTAFPGTSATSHNVCAVKGQYSGFIMTHYNCNSYGSNSITCKDLTKFMWAIDFKISYIDGTSKKFNQAGSGLDNFFSNEFIINLHSSDIGLSSSDLKDRFMTGKCTDYLYLGVNKDFSKAAYILSDHQIINYKEIFSAAGYDAIVDDYNYNESGQEAQAQAKIKNYNEAVSQLKDNIALFDKYDWGNIYDPTCSEEEYFGGGVLFEHNIPVKNYKNAREALQKLQYNYDFTEGDKLFEEYKNKTCAKKSVLIVEDEDSGITLFNLSCKELFQDINGNYNSTHAILVSALKFMQYIGIILAFVLSIFDFVKAVSSQDSAALTKSAIKAATRFGIAIIVFFAPMLINFIFDLVGFNNATCSLL